MVNLIAGKRIVPELIQHDFTVANVVRQIDRLLPDGDPRESMMKDLAQIRSKLNSRTAGQDGKCAGAIERVAAITLEEIRREQGASAP
jgi:lipid-A-disaccharide synthase